MARKRKGGIKYFRNRSKSAERELVYLLRKNKWRADRTPTSASGNVNLTDVTAVKPKKFFCFEIKAIDRPRRVKIRKLQLEKMFMQMRTYQYAGLNTAGFIAIRTYHPKKWHFYRVKSTSADLIIDMCKNPGLNWFEQSTLDSN